jgi:hypothetical protein
MPAYATITLCNLRGTVEENSILTFILRSATACTAPRLTNVGKENEPIHSIQAFHSVPLPPYLVIHT